MPRRHRTTKPQSRNPSADQPADQSVIQRSDHSIDDDKPIDKPPNQSFNQSVPKSQPVHRSIIVNVPTPQPQSARSSGQSSSQKGPTMDEVMAMIEKSHQDSLIDKAAHKTSTTRDILLPVKQNGVVKGLSPQLIMCKGDDLWQPKGEFMLPNVKVVKESDITLRITYPLSKPVQLSLTRKGGFTRKQLVHAIVATYERIYKEEEETMTSRMPMPPLLNRAPTNGLYGIMFHDIDDLWLEEISYDPVTKLVTLSIGS